MEETRPKRMMNRTRGARTREMLSLKMREAPRMFAIFCSGRPEDKNPSHSSIAAIFPFSVIDIWHFRLYNNIVETVQQLFSKDESQ